MSTNERYPLFVCCKHGEQTFDDIKNKECCFHTFGFTKHRRITGEYRENRNDMMNLCRELHSRKD